MGMGLSNGPSSSAATASVPEEQVGEASGVSNMARYVGAAVATALAATVYGTVTENQQADGASAGDALASGLAAASWVMVVFSALGILLALVAIRRHRAAQGTVADAAASAAAHLHTLPTTAAGAEPVPTTSPR
jgi:sugar phosphate permease